MRLVERFEVEFTEGAQRDLEAIHGHIAAHHSASHAERLLSRLLVAAEKLAVMPPDRGAIAPELLAPGIREYRQIQLNPYRLIYRVSGRSVVVYLVADSRRDMQSLLAQRLLSQS